MDSNGRVPVSPTGPVSPAELILQQKKDVPPSAPSGDGGLWSQLTNNPLFTAVRDPERVCCER